MLGKLLKYDFRSILRNFIPLWIAFLVISVINRFTLRYQYFSAYGFEIEINSTFASLASGIIFFIYIALMIAINVIGLVLIIQRFYNGLLKDEGYLMFTLPAKPWQLIASKGITATVVLVVNGFVSVLSVFILAAGNDFIRIFNEVIDALIRVDLNVGMLVFLSIILILVSSLACIYQIYASMALGHLAPKHRVAFSAGAFLGISVVLSIISSVILNLVNRINGPEWLYNIVTNMSNSSIMNAVMIIMIVVSLIELAAFHVITERVMSKRLNLE